MVALVRTPDDVHYLTYEIAREMATEQKLRYAELTCTPYTSVRPDDRRSACRSRPTPRRSSPPGSTPSATSASCCAGSTTSPASSGLPAGEATLAYALDHRPEALVGFGLGGPEIGVPAAAVPAASSTPPAQPVCTRCRTPARRPVRRRCGTRSACSAPSGSATAPRRRRTRRCSPTSPSTGIPLEVCPSSNIATRAVASLAEHPIRGVPGRRRGGHDRLRRPADVRHDAQP